MVIPARARGVLPFTMVAALLLAACGSGAASQQSPAGSRTATSSAPAKPASSPATGAASRPGPSGARSSSVGVALPVIPAPVAVKLDPKTTAYLILDDTNIICKPRQTCLATLPAVAALLKRARAAGTFVAYSMTPTKGSVVLPQIAPTSGEPVVLAHADKFYGTQLNTLLKQHGVKTVVIAGTVANGAVLYTAFDANEHGYTVVVPLDGTSAVPFAMLLSEYQLLNQPGYSNPTNQALKKDAVTLSTTAKVSFS